MRIGARDTRGRVLVIAEIGNNHEGSYAAAEEMIGLAAGAGADAVKFQTIVPERLVSRTDPDRLGQLERFRLSYDEFERLAATAHREGVLFLSTPFDVESVEFLRPLVPAYKVASGDNDFAPLLEAVAATGLPVMLSAGLATLAEIETSLGRIREVWRARGTSGELAVLHCVSSYPTPPEQANLRAIRTLERLGITVGYSDHTLGPTAAVLAVAVGARIVEKHFTLSKTHSTFRDHQLSADPGELSELVTRIREAEILLGDGTKRVQPAEAGGLTAARRSVVARRDLPRGVVLARDDLDWLRPGGGVAPGDEAALLGRVLARPIVQGERILADDVV